MALDSAARRKLKAQAHALSAIIQTGGKGVTAAVIAETETAIDHHELIKVRLAGSERDERAKMAQSLANSVKAEVVGIIGAVVILYRKAKPKKAAPKSTDAPKARRIRSDADVVKWRGKAK
ncbi:MAG: YhbY family RNA-binding protein [Oceanococcus sp.]